MDRGVDGSLEQFRKTELVTIEDQSYVMDAQALARRHGIHHLVVTCNHSIAGVVCTCDMMLSPPDTLVHDLMHEPAVLPIDATTDGAAQLMEQMHVGSVVLMDHERLCGIVTRGQLFLHDPLAAERAGLSRCGCCGSTAHLRHREGRGVLCIFCVARLEGKMSS